MAWPILLARLMQLLQREFTAIVLVTFNFDCYYKLRLKKWKNSGKVTALFVSPRSGKSWGLLLCDTNMQLRHRKQLSGLMVCGPNVDTDPNLQHVKVHWQLHQRLETLSYK
ncbi:uncharacterized protein LOC133722411 isoform X2 [Rosa rugosa]|uniref:uncharacterized protein LOC133722411 isoform X2 n=1 Tax=Rosa rugosa TaxID=74645 RepID=UPI002B40669D|nr:uncharacterized protein LOC133722411 isoform X2 [Rosa rugosa]